MKLHSVEDAIKDLQAGKQIILIDDPTRENEGDLVLLAEHVTGEHLNFMRHHGRGLICLSISEEIRNKLKLPPQVSQNTSHFHTNFAVSFDAKEISEQSSSYENRAKTILKAISADSTAEDFIRPGHVVTVTAVPGGVFIRRGQTEGSVDLARLAGSKSAAIICEILSQDGTVLVDSKLEDFAKLHNLKIVSIEQIRKYRLANKDVFVRKISEAAFTKISAYRDLKLVVYENELDNLEQLVIIKGKVQENALVRIHSECLTGDIFSSRRCDCGSQFFQTLELMEREGSGIILYLQQEGRGIGLTNKLRAYNLQDEGFDTVQANINLGFEADLRDYTVAAKILTDLNISKIRLITNNPFKMKQISALGIEISERVALPLAAHSDNMAYLNTKKEKLGHLF